MKTKLLVSFMGIYLLVILVLLSCSGEYAGLKYKPNWRSLSQWECPEWFDKAVLGFYCHWGVYSVPEYRFNDGAEQVDSGLWYGAFMYVPNDARAG